MPTPSAPLASDLTTVSCPTCATRVSLRLTERLVAKPVGTYSLAGAAPKVSAVSWPALECTTPGCEFVEFARINGYKPTDRPTGSATAEE